MIKKVFFLTASFLLTLYSYATENVVDAAPARRVFYSRHGTPDDIVTQQKVQEHYEECWELYNNIAQHIKQINRNEEQSILIPEEIVRKEFLKQLLASKEQSYNTQKRLKCQLERFWYLGYKECSDEKSYKLAYRSIDFADDVIRRLFTWRHLQGNQVYKGLYIPVAKGDFSAHKNFFENTLFDDDARLPVAIPLLDKRLSYLALGSLDERINQARLALAFVVIGRGYSLFNLLREQSGQEEKGYSLGTLTQGKGLGEEITDLIRVWIQIGWHCPVLDERRSKLPYLQGKIKKYFPNVSYRQPTHEELENCPKELGK